MMELSEISVGDELVLQNGAEGERVVVGKVGTRCVYATNHERGYVVVAAPQRFSRPRNAFEGRAMSSPLEEFRVGDKVTVHDPLIDEGVVTRVGRKYVTVTPENSRARGLAMPRLGRRAEVYVLPVMVTHRPGDDRHPH